MKPECLNVTEALSAEQKGELKRIPRPPFVLNRVDSPDSTVKQEVGEAPKPLDVRMVTPPRLKKVKTELSEFAVQQKEPQRPPIPTSLEIGSDDLQHSEVSSMESDMDIINSQESKVRTYNASLLF